MAQTDERYFATYCRLDKVSDNKEGTVNGEVIPVGMELLFEREEFVTERGKESVRGIIRDVQGGIAGFLPAECARRFCDLAADGWIVRVAASAIGFHEADRVFWVEAAVMAYEPQYADAFSAFFNGCCDRLGAGERPDIRLSSKLIDAALENKKFYKEVKPTSYPKLKKGDAYYKRRRTQSESMIVKGSQRKMGCYIGTAIFWVVVIAIIAAIVYFVFIK